MIVECHDLRCPDQSIRLKLRLTVYNIGVLGLESVRNHHQTNKLLALPPRPIKLRPLDLTLHIAAIRGKR